MYWAASMWALLEEGEEIIEKERMNRDLVCGKNTEANQKVGEHCSEYVAVS